MTSALDSLPPKRRAFVEAYCGEAQGNGTEAARIAGYAHPQQESVRLLRNALVADAIARHAEKVTSAAISTAEERQAWLSDVHRGLVADRDGAASLRDRMKALELLGKMRGDFIERSEVEHKGHTALVLRTEEDLRRLAADGGNDG